VDEEHLPCFLELAEQRLGTFDELGSRDARAGEAVPALAVREGAQATARLRGHLADSRVVRVDELVVAVDLHRGRE
jgi:hypothetical protein